MPRAARDFVRAAGSTMVTVVPSPTALSIEQHAAMQLDQRLGDGKAQPGAFETARQRSVELAERFQRRGDGFRRHADAGVRHGEGHATRRSSRTERATAPPGGVNFSALVRRLASAWRSRCGSTSTGGKMSGTSTLTSRSSLVATPRERNRLPRPALFAE